MLTRYWLHLVVARVSYLVEQFLCILVGALAEFIEYVLVSDECLGKLSVFAPHLRNTMKVLFLLVTTFRPFLPALLARRALTIALEPRHFIQHHHKQIRLSWRLEDTLLFRFWHFVQATDTV